MNASRDTGFTCLALNCTLKRGRSSSSSTDKLLREVLDALAAHAVSGEVHCATDFSILPGVSADEGDGDEWPVLRRRILESDILVLGTPIWLGQPSSVAKQVLERMDALLGEADERGRMPPYGKVAVIAVVGNGDGAHHCHAEIFHALNDVGFSLPPSPQGGGTYWVGEAMGSVDY